MPERCSRDPRDALVQDKYYTHLPDPLLDWLIRARIPDSAKRVFLAHWRAGHINGDWCSEIPLKTLASQCQLDISTVTRAYQLLSRHGLIRRQDPGRDPTRPFQQAVALTEVRLPKELIQQLDRYPNRRATNAQVAAHAPTESDATSASPTAPAPNTAPSSPPSDPFCGLSLRARTQALNGLIERMSPAERARYHDAVRLFHAAIDFDPDSGLSADEQQTVLRLLIRMAKAPSAPGAATRPETSLPPSKPQPRRLSALEVARLRRDLQAVRGATEADELLREVLWSAEEGALSRFNPLHAARIALKKIREGAWSRPNRMPPQWARNLARPTPSRQVQGTRGRGGARAAGLRSSSPSVPIEAAPKITVPARNPSAAGPLAIASLLSARPSGVPPAWAGPELCRGA